MKYSVILPVRNGAQYIKECISSILAQEYPHFELIILENCSTDATLQIIHSFQDPRIKCFPASSPLTIEENWGRIRTIAKSEFITLIGHDDLLDAKYLTVMEQLILENPQASLYHAHFRYIDGNGVAFSKCQPMERIQPATVAVSGFISGRIDLMGTGFMMRSIDYDRVGGIPPYPGLLFADMQLWIEIAKRSGMVVAKEEIFSYRKHPGSTTSSSADQRFVQAFDLLINYLVGLKVTNPELSAVIEVDGKILLRQYCQGITHKILRTPYKERKTKSVAEIIDQFRSYGKELGIQFEPLDYKKIKLGLQIDQNKMLHTAYLLFKKIYSGAIFKARVLVDYL